MLFPKGLQSLRNAPRAQVAIAVFACLFLLTFLHQSSSRPSPPITHQPDPLPGAKEGSPKHVPIDVTCGVDTALLTELGISNKIKYGRIDINVHTCHTPETCSSTGLNASMPEFRVVHLDAGIEDDHGSGRHGEKCSSPVNIQMPPVPTRPDASNLIVGVATKINRLEESLGQFPHWMGYTGVRLVAILEPTTTEKVHEVQERARSLGISLEVEQSDAEYNDRYYSLTKVLYEKRDESTEWGVIIDDDTFFPSIAAVEQYLHSLDASKPHYVGGLTEDFFQTRNFGYMGYGGAGVFLSIPLLKQMHPHYEKCNENKATGDRRIADCVHWHTLTKFSPNVLFHQLDMGGDLSGFYESGRTQPLSFHHWKSWHEANVTAMFAVATVTGDDSLLQRWQFDDGWYFTNGYSVVKYSENLPEGDITMEQTWNGAGSYGHSMDPTRPKDEKKISFRLKAAERDHEGRVVRQYYVKSIKEKDDEVLEIVWRRI